LIAARYSCPTHRSCVSRSRCAAVAATSPAAASMRPISTTRASSPTYVKPPALRRARSPRDIGDSVLAHPLGAALDVLDAVVLGVVRVHDDPLVGGLDDRIDRDAAQVVLLDQHRERLRILAGVAVELVDRFAQRR